MADSADLIVICPTRGRPSEAREVEVSFETTATRLYADSSLLFALDDDDPLLEMYQSLGLFSHVQSAPGNMVKALNGAAAWAIVTYNPRYLGFVGDDHRFRSHGWDDKIIRALDKMEGGVVYGNDLAQGERLPTQVFMSAQIVAALGWMGLPSCKHLYIDNAWMTIGEGVGLRYLPDVVIEHLHPAFGKAVWDEGHLRVNTPEMYGHDKEAFDRWLATRAADDIGRARDAL